MGIDKDYYVFVDETGNESGSSGSPLFATEAFFALTALVVPKRFDSRIRSFIDKFKLSVDPEKNRWITLHRREIFGDPKDTDGDFLRKIKVEGMRVHLYRSILGFLRSDDIAKSIRVCCAVWNINQRNLTYEQSQGMSPYETLMANVLRHVSGFLDSEKASAEIFIEDYNKDFGGRNLNRKDGNSRAWEAASKFINQGVLKIPLKTNKFWAIDLAKRFSGGVTLVDKTTYTPGLELLDLISPEILCAALKVFNIQIENKAVSDTQSLIICLLLERLFHRRLKNGGLTDVSAIERVGCSVVDVDELRDLLERDRAAQAKAMFGSSSESD